MDQDATGGIVLDGDPDGSPSNTTWLAEAYLHTKWYPDTSSCLAKIHMGRKVGAAMSFFGGRVLI